MKRYSDSVIFSFVHWPCRIFFFGKNHSRKERVVLGMFIYARVITPLFLFYTELVNNQLFSTLANESFSRLGFCTNGLLFWQRPAACTRADLWWACFLSLKSRAKLLHFQLECQVKFLSFIVTIVVITCNLTAKISTTPYVNRGSIFLCIRFG